jgi:hypothetical protein
MANYSASIKIDAATNLDTVAKKIGASFSKMQTSAAQASSAFADVRHHGAAVAKGLAVASGVAVAAGAAVFGLAKSVANLGDDLAKTSQKTGIGVKELQRLRYSAELGGASAQDLSTGLKTFGKAIDEASQGTKEYQEAFDRIAISTKNADGSLKNTDALMMEVADRFASMEDGAQKAAIAQQLFGKGGLAMIPMLNQGSKALKEQGDWLEANATLLTDDQAKAGEAFNDQLLRLRKSISNLTVPIATKLIPAITEIAVRMTDFFSNIRDHLPMIHRAAKILGGVAIALGVMFGPLMLKAALTPLIGLAVGLVKLTAAAWSFNAALLANPITWIIVGIVALGAAIFLLVKHWDTVRAAMGHFWDAFKEVIGNIASFWSAQFEPMFAMMKRVGDFFGKFGKGKGQKFETVDTQEMIGDAALTNSHQLDVNMKIDQDGRARVTGAKSDANLSFHSQTALMMPMF